VLDRGVAPEVGLIDNAVLGDSDGVVQKATQAPRFINGQAGKCAVLVQTTRCVVVAAHDAEDDASAGGNQIDFAEGSTG